MFIDFTHYKVKVRPKPFTTSAGIEYDSTACVSFFDDSNKEQAYFELGYINAESVYEAIDAGNPIILDECYIENLSIHVYRKSRIIPDKTMVKLNNFSAKGTFFDSKITTDFSYAFFQGNDLSFHKCRFINGRVSFHKAEFADGDVDFSRCIFKNGEIDFSNAIFHTGDTSFNHSVFMHGMKNFQYTDFGDGNVDFMNCWFGEGDLNFINTNFGDGNISFKAAHLGSGKKDFQFSQFGNGDISFERTEFGNGKVDFRRVEFHQGKINFNRASFGEGEVTFEESELNNSRLTFKKTNFGSGDIHFEEVDYRSSNVLFDQSQFEDCNLFFAKSWFKKLSLISCHLDNYVDFRVYGCDILDLSDTITRDIVDFSSYEHEVQIGTLNLAGMRLLGQLYIDWYRNNVKEIINNQENTSFSEKAEQFRILKENYGRIGNYKSEDLAYIQFKRNEQKADLQKSLKKSRLSAIWQGPLFAFKFIVVDRMGLYATSPLRVISSLIIIYLGFTFIHFVAPYLMNTGISCIDPDAGFIIRLLDTFYYSIITFTTVGYGDCSPHGFLRTIASLEGFVGPFMMSYFTVAFARKILR